MINEIKMLFLGVSKFKVGFIIIFFIWPVIEYLIFGNLMTFNYILLGMIAFFTITSVFGSYRLLNNFSVWVNETHENFDDLDDDNKILLSSINRIWSVNKTLSILVFGFLIVSLLMLQKNIIEIPLIYSATWMIYVLSTTYDSLLLRVVTHYRIYNTK